MKTLRTFVLMLLLALLAWPCPLLAFDQWKFLDLAMGEKSLSGRIVAHDEHRCWLLARDGRMSSISIEKVTSFTERKERFLAASQMELKNRLQAELGKSFDVKSTQHYVVAAPIGFAEQYAGLFEQIYREFVTAFRTRGLNLADPEFPLMAIVFPNQTQFSEYCRTEGITIRPGLVGCYLSESNRVATYQRSNPNDVDATLIHEATHQVAFNTGLHSRLADQPKWVIEGLATVFEVEGMRSRQSSASASTRVNRERVSWFKDYVKARRPPKGLKLFLSSNHLFDVATLDAYSEAWALSFYLIETRPIEYAAYLKKLASINPLNEYDMNARLTDFKRAFGNDLDEFEAAYLRYMQRITANH